MIVYFLKLNCFVFCQTIAIYVYIKDYCELMQSQQSKNLNQNNISENKKLTKKRKWISDNLIPLQVTQVNKDIITSLFYNNEILKKK